MKVKTLIKILSEVDGELEVKVADQSGMEGAISLEVDAVGVWRETEPTPEYPNHEIVYSEEDAVDIGLAKEDFAKLKKVFVILHY